MANLPTDHLDGPPRRRFQGGPLVRPGRLVGLDLARALALVGMISTHLLPSIVDHRATLSHQLAGGPSSALFALLAGVSLALVTGRQHPLHGRARLVASVGLFVRALLIYAFGLWLAHRPTDIAVILPHYGVLFVLALPFLGLRARGAAIAAAIWVVGAPFALRASLGHVPEDGVYGWHTLQQIVFTGTYPATVWLAYLLAGLAIGRLDLRRRITMVWLAVGGGGLAVLAAVTSDRLLLRTPIMNRLVDDIDPRGTAPDLYPVLRQGLYGFVPKGSWWWLATHTAHSGTPFDLARTIGTSLLVIGLCLLVAEVVPRTVAVVGGAGAMTLSLYSLHVLMKSDGIWPDDVPASFKIHVVVVVGLGAAFRVAGRKGPMETVVAWVSRQASNLTRRALGPDPAEPDRGPDPVQNAGRDPEGSRPPSDQDVSVDLTSTESVSPRRGAR